VSLLALGAVLALIVAGCGSDSKTSGSGSSYSSSSSSAASGAAQTIKLSADPGGALKFTQTTLEAKAGKVTLEMANPSKIAHGIGVDGNGVDVDGPVVGPGKTSTATATFKAGTYEYYCTVKSHHQAGMKGTLVVK
jgi:plastocyanin